MSVDLGSAHGAIVLDSNGVTRGVAEAEAALAAFEARAARSAQALTQVERAGSGFGGNLARGTAGAAQALAEVEEASQRAGQATRQMGQAGQAGGQAVAAGGQQANTALREVAGSAASTEAALRKVSTAALTIGGVLTAALGIAVKQGADFEKGIDAVGAVSGATKEQLQQLGDLAVQLGKDQTLAGISAGDAAKAEEELAKAGVSVADQLGGATRGALLLASAGATSVGEASEIAANALTIFGLKGQDVAHVADLFAAAANASTIEVHDIGLAMSQAGQVSAQFGQTIEETTAVLAAFGAAGLKSSDAGTSIKTMLIALTNPSKEAAAVMQQYGLSFFDADGHMKDFIGIADELRTKLAGLTDQQRGAALATIFGSDAIRSANILYKEGGDGIQAWVGKVDQAGSAAEVGAARNDNLRGSLDQLQGSFEAAEIAASKFVLPDLKRAADGASQYVNAFSSLPDSIQRTAIYGAAATAGFALLAGAALKVKGALGDLKDMGEAVIGMFIRKEAAKKSLTAANQKLAGSVDGTGFALTKLGAGVGIAAVAILTANEAAEAFAGESLPDLIISVLKYGDAWGKGRDEAQHAFDAAQGNLVAVQAEIDATILKIEELKQHANDPSFGKFFRDLFAGNVEGGNIADPQIQQSIEKLRTLRLLQAGFVLDPSGHIMTGVVKNTATGANIENTAKDAAQAAAANDVLSKSYFQAQKAAQGLADANQEAANRAAGIGTAWASIGEATAAEQQAAQAGDVLSESLLTARQSAIDTAAALERLGEQRGVADQLAADDAAMQSLNAQMGPLQAALDQINAKRAAGIPLTAQEADLLQRIPGALGQAANAYDALAIKKAGDILLQQQLAGSADAAGANFVAFAGTAGALQSRLDALRASAIQLDGALGALGNQNSKLAAEYNILQDRIDVLNQKKKEQGSLNAQDQAELARLTAAQKVLGDQMGENAAKERDVVLAQADNAKQTRDAAAAQKEMADGLARLNPNLGEASDGLVGLTDGFGSVATAAGSTVDALAAALASAHGAGDAAADAAVQTDTYHHALDTIPPGVNTDVTTSGLQESIDGIGLLQGAIDNTPRSFTIVANVDINPAVAGIEAINRMLPHSPAEEGPLSTLPNWDALFDIRPAGERGAVLMRQATDRLVGALDTGMDEAQQEAAKKAADLLSAIASAVKAGQDALEGLANFRLAPNAVANGQAVIGALRPLIDQFVADAQAFADGALEAGGKVASAAQSAASAVKAGVDAFSAINSFVAPAPAKVEAFLESLVGVVTRLTDIASLLGTDGVAAAAAFSDDALKVVNLLGPGVEGMSALTDFKVPSDEQMLVFGERLLRVIVRIGEIGNLLETQGVADAAKFASDSMTIVNLLRPGAEGFTALTDFKVPSDEQIRVFGERLLTVIVRIGEIGNLLETEGVKEAGDFSEGAQKVVSILNSATGFNAIAELEPPSDAQLENFVHQTVLVVQRIEQAARNIDQDGVKAAGQYGDSASKAVGLIGTAVSAFRDLKDFVAPSQQAIDGVIAVSRAATDRLIALARQYDKGTLDQLGAFADATGKGFNALKSALDAAKAVTEAKDTPDPGTAVNSVLGRYQGALGPLQTLSAVAAQWQTLAAGIRTSLTQAFGDLGTSLALTGGNPQALGIVAGAAVVQRSEITITLQMPADDGQFVARSLKVDGKARHDVAEMIDAEIADMIDAA